MTGANDETDAAQDKRIAEENIHSRVAQESFDKNLQRRAEDGLLAPVTPKCKRSRKKKRNISLNILPTMSLLSPGGRALARAAEGLLSQKGPRK